MAPRCFLLALPAAALNATDGNLCGGAGVVDASSDWLWSHEAVPSPSCSSPAVENVAQMCAGDPTSVVIRGNGQPQCLSAAMPDCKFNMHDIDQLDFDTNMLGCKGTWAAPLWMTPNHWAGGGESGEIDMLENCPTDKLWSNFAAGGQQVSWPFNTDSFSGHTSMWKQADGDGVVSIHVKTCDTSEVVDGSCPETGDVAYLRDIYGKNGCKGADCIYMMVSDIWNGLSGDDGYQGCAGGKTHPSSGCSLSVSNIRFKASASAFPGKCAKLLDSESPKSSTTQPETTAPPTTQPQTTATPTSEPETTAAPTAEPATTAAPTAEPETTAAPTAEPETTASPTAEPETTAAPTEEPETTAAPTAEPETTAAPTAEPETTAAPTAEPETTAAPTAEPETTAAPTAEPETTATPTAEPETTAAPTAEPETTAAPTVQPETTSSPSSRPTTQAPPTLPPAECQACDTICSPCQDCIEGPDGTFLFGSCDKCWHCWDWSKDKLEDRDEKMSKHCDVMYHKHKWDDKKARCLTDYPKSDKVTADCRACWAHLGGTTFVV